MLTDTMVLLSNAMTFAIQTADRVFGSMGDVVAAVLAVFVIYSSYRFFLRPIVGGAGSDRVKGKRGGREE